LFVELETVAGLGMCKYANENQKGSKKMVFSVDVRRDLMNFVLLIIVNSFLIKTINSVMIDGMQPV